MPTKVQQIYQGLRDRHLSFQMANVYAETNPTLSAVMQATNRATGVTVATRAGAVTTNNASLAAETAAAFVVTCPGVGIGDVVVVSQRSGSNGGMTDIAVSAVANGSFTINVMNNNAAAGAAETGAIIINYAVIQART